MQTELRTGEEMFRGLHGELHGVETSYDLLCSFFCCCDQRRQKAGRGVRSDRYAIRIGAVREPGQSSARRQGSDSVECSIWDGNSLFEDIFAVWSGQAVRAAMSALSVIIQVGLAVGRIQFQASQNKFMHLVHVYPYSP